MLLEGRRGVGQRLLMDDLMNDPAKEGNRVLGGDPTWAVYVTIHNLPCLFWGLGGSPAGPGDVLSDVYIS